MPTQTDYEQVRTIAQRLYRNRELLGQRGDADRDWQQAEHIYRNPIRHTLFRLNQPFIRLEKHAIEPLADWVERADVFRIIERISPAIEALGILAIPLVLFFASQSYQKELQQQEAERIQQQAVKEYLTQLSSIITTAEGDLLNPKNKQLQVLTTATTLTLMNEPNLDGVRKGQVITFLTQMNLINQKAIVESSRSSESRPTLELDRANLSEAYLPGVNLRGALLRGADLRKANLIGADLRGADLSGANLSEADLSRADLSDADLGTTNLTETDFNQANLNNANLSQSILVEAFLGKAELEGANLSNSNLSRTYLSYAENLSSTQLEKGFLCQTRLPTTAELDRNRDCEQLLNPE